MENFVRQLILTLRSFRGRQSNTTSLRANLLKTLLQSLILWTFFFGVGPWLVTRIESHLGIPPLSFSKTIAVLLFVVGGMIAWLSAYYLVKQGQGTPLPVDSTNRLVVAGPYCFIRNPMAVGSLSQSVAMGLLWGSPLVVTYTFAGGLFWNFTVRLWEEADLEAKFGAEYTRYRQGVRCWIPRLTPYRA